MILKSKFNFYQIYKIIFLLFLTNISNLYAHNIINGGCKVHCEHKVKSKNNKNKLPIARTHTFRFLRNILQRSK